MFKKSHSIKTSLSKEEIIAILQTKVENFHRDNSKFDFEGNVNLRGEINIKPTFDFGPREQFRPEILGKIHGSSIDLEFTISSFLKRLFLLIIAMEFVFVVFIYNKFEDLQVLLFFPFLLIFFLVLKFTFDSKVKKSIALLESYFK
ncbi:hypothetical protein [Flavobacterium proteolyticum]|uniref:Uncharacterized protein n=1 Tax=Flavobacterium proteolyticum TaxID=2911683 RepID=A0ABR9WPE1_9FLAO|nr:hypothetical protein [Flavobacterium proteolyticum]MBE9575707.1 hypothetical protein [Flavobacterium proteolyticum]